MQLIAVFNGFANGWDVLTGVSKEAIEQKKRNRAKREVKIEVFRANFPLGLGSWAENLAFLDVFQELAFKQIQRLRVQMRSVFLLRPKFG